MYYKVNGVTQRLTGAPATVYRPQLSEDEDIACFCNRPHICQCHNPIMVNLQCSGQIRFVMVKYKGRPFVGQVLQIVEEEIEGLRPGVPPVSPPVIFASPTKLASETGSQVEYLGANKVPDLQRLFQRPDGVPIHLKGGLMDKLLYRTTMGLTVGGALYCLIALYFAAQPSNK